MAFAEEEEDSDRAFTEEELREMDAILFGEAQQQDLNPSTAQEDSYMPLTEEEQRAMDASIFGEPEEQDSESDVDMDEQRQGPSHEEYINTIYPPLPGGEGAEGAEGEGHGTGQMPHNDGVPPALDGGNQPPPQEQGHNNGWDPAMIDPALMDPALQGGQGLP